MCTCNVIKFHRLFVQLLHINSYSQTHFRKQEKWVWLERLVNTVLRFDVN